MERKIFLLFVFSLSLGSTPPPKIAANMALFVEIPSCLKNVSCHPGGDEPAWVEGLDPTNVNKAIFQGSDVRHSLTHLGCWSSFQVDVAWRIYLDIPSGCRSRRGKIMVENLTTGKYMDFMESINKMQRDSRGWVQILQAELSPLWDVLFWNGKVSQK